MTRSTIDRIFQSGQDFVQEILSTRECDEPEQAEPERKRRDLHFCSDKRSLNKSDFIGSFWETSTCVRHESKAYGDQPESGNRLPVRPAERAATQKLLSQGSSTFKVFMLTHILIVSATRRLLCFDSA